MLRTVIQEGQTRGKAGELATRPPEWRLRKLWRI